MLTYCLAEDRPEDTHLRLALLTLREHCPENPVVLFRHDPSGEFSEWLQDFPRVTLIPRRPEGATSWNCKPQALLTLLDRGLPEVVWLDSDLAFTRSCDPLFTGLPPETLVVAEDVRFPLHAGTLGRTKAWGLSPGKIYAGTINSCVLRVTEQHRPLLRRWCELLGDPRYQTAQRQPELDRPFHLRSDQDVLNALLGSQEFADTQVRFLRCGREIIHCSGRGRSYSGRERLLGLIHPIAPVLHNPSEKAWAILNPAPEAKRRTKFSERLFVEISPYVTLARKYEAQLGSETAWLRYRSPLGRLLRGLGFNHFALPGLPLVLALSTRKALQRGLAHALGR